MKPSALLRISVATNPEAEDAVTELFGRVFGQPASSYHDVESGEVTVSLYLPEPNKLSPDVRQKLRDGLDEIRHFGIEVGSGRITASTIRHKDWAEAWKRHFKPIAIGRRLLVKPSWSQRQALAGQSVVVIDPGLSFGTGQHPTTRFCLEQLTKCRIRRKLQSFLDIGTGSGILAIAAAKLGYGPVEAFDFDPDAVRIARANARRNRVTAKMHARRQDLTRVAVKPVRQFDIVCANLIYDVLIGERRRIINRMKPGGRLVLAGILREQFPAVQQTYEGEGLKLAACSAANEWESGAFEWR